MPDLSSIRHERERQFATAFFNHDEWEYQPGPYRLSNGETYRPDFLDKRRDVLIEVIGTRQAYSYNKGKYMTFITEHQDKSLEFRDENGNLLEYGPKILHGFGCTEFDMKERYGLDNPTNAISRYIAEKNITPYDLSKLLRVPASTVHRHLHEHRYPTLDVIAKYVAAGVPIEYFMEQIQEMANIKADKTHSPRGIYREKSREMVEQESMDILAKHIDEYSQMTGVEALKRHIELLGITYQEVIELTNLSQSLVSMTFRSKKNKRGIGGKAAMVYNALFKIPLEILLKR